MAGAKEIRGKIASIKNTQKITKAMEMVAASKMRKAQERMRAARPYAEKIRKIIGHLRAGESGLQASVHRWSGRSSRVGIIVISTDRGLCGRRSTLNLFKADARRHPRGAGAKMPRSACASIGVKATAVLPPPVRRRDRGVGHAPGRPAARQGSDRRRSRSCWMSIATAKIDQLLLVHNVFVNTMTQKAMRHAAAAASDHRQGRAAGALGLHLRAGRRRRFSTAC